MDRTEINRFVLRLVAFLAVLGLPVAVELVVLPTGFFNFRMWEANRVWSAERLLPGPFYPRVRMEMSVQGDLGHHTPYAVDKNVAWETDRHGYRVADSMGPPEVVIIGDSFIVGSGLTQHDTPASALQRLVGVPVYPLAPANLNTYLSVERFQARPPKVVVLAQIERNALQLPLLDLDQPQHYIWNRPFTQLRSNATWQGLIVLVDRALNSALLNSSRVRLAGRRPVPEAFGPDHVLFFRGADANEEVPTEDIERAVSRLTDYRDWFAAEGVRFLYVPIPNKESVRYRLIPGARRPDFIPRLVARLGQEGIPAIDTQRLFEEALASRGGQLYQTDDAHWSALGVQVAVSQIAAYVREEGWLP